MNNSALILMVATQLIVTVITIYLFKKVLKTPPNPEPDSFIENEPEV